MPVEDYLGRCFTLCCGYFSDHGVIKGVSTDSTGAPSALPTYWTVGLKCNIPLVVEAEHIRVVTVGMDFDLVDGRLDLTAGQQVDHHWHGAASH